MEEEEVEEAREDYDEGDGDLIATGKPEGGLVVSGYGAKVGAGSVIGASG